MEQHESKKRTIEKRQQKEKAALLEALRKTPVVQIACAKTGIGRATYYRWTKEDPVFSAAVENALEDGTDLVSDMSESNIIKSIGEGNLSSSKYWLENHRLKYRKPKKVFEGEESKIRLLLDL